MQKLENTKEVFYTHHCDEIDESLVGSSITISGWVENIRDHGGVLFLDLRDTTDILQLVSNDDEMFAKIPKESVIKVRGILRKRDEETYNSKLKTGAVELLVDDLTILNKSREILPFEIRNSKNVNEELRLKYRYLDLRNKNVLKNFQLRSKVLHYLRNKMDNLGFMEVQTPILSATSPEGARDFVVPSRNFKGKFYALPQAPQIYKELLMVGGISKYYQIAPCFRDEDPRSDRTLEFYQLDFEMSYVSEDEILNIGEEIFYDTFKEFSNKDISPRPFRRLSYQQAMDNYGSDKPDLRNPLIIQDATKILEHTSFKPFLKSTIKVIVVDDIGTNSNSWFNDIVDYASSIGMPGIGYLTLLDDEALKGPIEKFLSEEEKSLLINEFNMKSNSVMFFIANRSLKTAQKYAGLMRNYIGKKANLVKQNCYEFCIVNDFPMYEYDEINKKLTFCHNPFSLPKNGTKAYDTSNYLDIIAYQYDFVCNGYEMASGAIRNHDLDSLVKGFEIVGHTRKEVEQRFSSIYRAFSYGCPPHGGMAPGIDRILMLLLDETNLREVQVFPPSASGADSMMGSPSTLSALQLKELGIKIVED